MKKSLLIIDGMYLIFSSFYSHSNMRTLRGEPTGAIYGFISRIESLIKELNPDMIAVAFDSKEKTFRHKLYEAYKAKRLIPPEELEKQIPFVKEYLNIRNIKYFEINGFEADDIIKSLVDKYSDKYNIYIFTSDKDLFQLVDENVSIYHPKLKKILNKEGIKEKFGVFPNQIVDFLSLTGDSSDNIPGVSGIGEKTALKLIEKYGSLDNIINNLTIIEEKYSKKIKKDMENLKLSKELIDLRKSPAMNIDLYLNEFENEYKSELYDFYKRFSFNSLIKKIDFKREKDNNEIKYIIIDDLDKLKALKDKLIEAKSFVFDIETTNTEFFKSDIIGISICINDREGYYTPFLNKTKKINFTDFKQELENIFQSDKIKKSGHNIKFDILHLKDKGMEVNGISDDSMIISYLLHPERRSHKLKELTMEYLDYIQQSYDDLIKKNDKLEDIDINIISKYCIDDSVYSLKLINLLKPELKNENLQDLYDKVEIPLVEVLKEMEYRGVKINTEYINASISIMKKNLEELTNKIYTIAGYEFNINSSQQLGELLFEKMNLPITKRTRKTRAYSTDIEVLNELKNHEVVEKIIDYRTYKKLLSTYLIGLLDNIDNNNRIHTSYNQTITATGRLSSSNPNLQNIPVGEMGGINVRKAFVAEKGYGILSADYSQIELRVMAHFSNDKYLIEAFNNNMDIHKQTADLILSSNLFLNKQEKRKKAKIINFSVLYGSGPYSLSKELGVSYKEAKEFIEMYFEKFKGVKKFIDDIIKKTEINPEVKTIMGRKRYISEIQSSNKTVKENGKRMAINTIIQGSAADIIKVAMINIYKRIKDMKSKLIMQVHDELIFEYKSEEEKELINIIQQEMQNSVRLKVPLIINIKKGNNWGELFPINP